MAKQIPLSEIRIDGGTQSRAAMDQGTVDDYAEHIDALPPADVYHDGEHHWLADGFYRFHAHAKLKRESMACVVHKGTLDDAKWHAAGANKSHGLRRTNEDKEKAVKMALALSDATKRSDREIADHCGVSPTTVGKYREELTPTVSSAGVQIGHQETSKRVGRDGVAQTVDSAKRSEAAKESAAKKKEALRDRLHGPVKEAWDANELTVAQAKKIAELEPLYQVAELKKIRAKAAKTAAPRIEPPVDEDESSPDETIEQIIKRKNHDIESFCRRIVALADECPQDEWLEDMNKREGFLRKIKDACGTVRSAKCAGVCPKCEGEGCRKCRNTGRMPKYYLDQIGGAA